MGGLQLDAARIRRRSGGNRFALRPCGSAMRTMRTAVAAPEPAGYYGERMDTPDKPTPAPDRCDPTKMTPTLGHLLLRDTRTPEEQRAASLKESARRKGRGRGKWWEKGGA